MCEGECECACVCMRFEEFAVHMLCTAFHTFCKLINKHDPDDTVTFVS